MSQPEHELLTRDDVVELATREVIDLGEWPFLPEEPKQSIFITPAVYIELKNDGSKVLHSPSGERNLTGITDDGWINWEGGDCPVPHLTIVDVVWRDGSIFMAQQAWGKNRGKEINDQVEGSSFAGLAFWEKDGGSNDIVAYRLHKPLQSIQFIADPDISEGGDSN